MGSARHSGHSEWLLRNHSMMQDGGNVWPQSSVIVFVAPSSSRHTVHGMGASFLGPPNLPLRPIRNRVSVFLGCVGKHECERGVEFDCGVRAVCGGVDVDRAGACAVQERPGG